MQRTERPFLSLSKQRLSRLDLATYRSGKLRGQTTLSRSGDARLRRGLWMAGQVAIRRKEDGFRDKFELYIARNRTNADLRRKALTADTAKMARVAHAVTTGGTEYRPFFEGGGARGIKRRRQRPGSAPRPNNGHGR